MYLSRTDPETILAGIGHDDPLQAYIVHNDKQGIERNTALWDLPSNTLGLVLTTCTLNHHVQRTFPRTYQDNMVMHFIPNVSIPPTFALDKFKTITTYNPDNAQEFYAGVEAAHVRYQHLMHGKRAPIRYVGRCIEEVRRKMNELGAVPCDATPGQRLQVQTRSLLSLRQITMPRQLGLEHTATHHTSLPWTDVASWAVDTSKKRSSRERARKSWS